MSISAMKQAAEALEVFSEHGGNRYTRAADALRQAIAEAEKQEPVAIGEEWKPCVKLPIIVHVREQRKGETHVSTREGITPVKEDDLIMRGVAGEEYPIGRELFNRTYTFDTAPVHASDISQERVDETAKHRHEDWYGQHQWQCGYERGWDAAMEHKREWVGLEEEEILKCFDSVALGQVEGDCVIDKHVNIFNAIRAIEAKLKEKNT